MKMLLENCNTEEDGKTKYTHDGANDRQLNKKFSEVVMVQMMMVVMMTMVAMVKLRRRMTMVTKMKVFLENSFRYYAIARPLQYHMVITGGSFT